MPLGTAGLPDFGSDPDRLLKIQRQHAADKFLKIEETVDLHEVVEVVENVEVVEG